MSKIVLSFLVPPYSTRLRSLLRLAGSSKPVYFTDTFTGSFVPNMCCTSFSISFINVPVLPMSAEVRFNSPFTLTAILFFVALTFTFGEWMNSSSC